MLPSAALSLSRAGGSDSQDRSAETTKDEGDESRVGGHVRRIRQVATEACMKLALGVLDRSGSARWLRLVSR